MTKVIHIKDAPPGWPDDPNYVYVGRKKKGLGDGFFGNPFPAGGDRTRAEAIEIFRQHAEYLVSNNVRFARAVAGLRGKTLVCFCHPKDCHGDVLAEMADQIGAPLDEEEDDLW